MSTNIQRIDKEDRTYQIEGVGIFPSSTTVISLLDKSGALMGWCAKIVTEYIASQLKYVISGDIQLTGDNAATILKDAKARYKDVKNEAADIGSEVHNVIEVYLKGQPVDYLLNERTIKPFEGFKKWQAEHDFKLVASEHTVYSTVHKFAGTLDCAAYLDGKLYIIDFKTSNSVKDRQGKLYPGYEMQTVSYLKAFEERTGKKIEGAGILRLDKATGEPEWTECDLRRLEQRFKGFLCLLGYWWNEQEVKHGV